MGQQTFFNPLAAALAAGQTPPRPVAPVVNVGPAQSAAPTPMPSTGFNAYGDGGTDMAMRMIENGSRRPQSGHWLEGVGNVAQLAAGHYSIARENDRQKERAAHVEAQVRGVLGDEAATMYRLADAKGRAELEGQFRAEAMNRIQAERTRQRVAAENQGFIDAKTEAEFNAHALKTGNPDYAKSIVSAHAAKIKERDAAQAEINRYAQVFSGGVDLEQLKQTDPQRYNDVMTKARATQAKIPLEALPGAGPQTGKFFDSWETARGADEKKALFAEAVKSHHETSKTIRTDSQSARRGLQALDVVEGALNSGTYTGTGFEQVQTLKKVGVALGLDIKNVSDGELINAVSNELAKGARAGYPGSVSNFEMQTYLRSVVSGQNTPEANRKIMAVLRDQMGEQVERQKDADSYIKLRRDQGKPAILAEGFDAYAAERSAERADARKARIAEVRETLGIKADGTPMSREERVRSQQSPQAPMAGGIVTQQARDPRTGDTVTLELRDGAWKETGRSAAPADSISGVVAP